VGEWRVFFNPVRGVGPVRKYDIAKGADEVGVPGWQEGQQQVTRVGYLRLAVQMDAGI